MPIDYTHKTWIAPATKAVARAIKQGVLAHPTTLKCAVCNRQASIYRHHKGYAPEHWLEVIPVCARKAHLANQSDPTSTDYTHDYVSKPKRPPLIIL